MSSNCDISLQCDALIRDHIPYAVEVVLKPTSDIVRDFDLVNAKPRKKHATELDD